VLVKKLQLGRRLLHSYRPRILLVPSPGSIAIFPEQSGAAHRASTSLKSPTAGGLEGPVYIVQNELSIRNSGQFRTARPGPPPPQTPPQNPPPPSPPPPPRGPRCPGLVRRRR